MLTKKGRQLIDEIRPRHTRAIQTILEFMPDELLSALNDLLGELRNGLKARPLHEADVAVRFIAQLANGRARSSLCLGFNQPDKSRSEEQRP